MASPDAFDDVADSTDWLSTPLSGVSAVEAALRCQVCKDFYKTPMLTSCNHTFCSICIRRALSNEGRCPLCRASDQEIKLRSNWSMEEVVDAFTKTRSDVLEFAQKPQEIIIEAPIQSAKRVLSTQGSQEVNEPKRLRSSARLGKTKGAELTAEIARQEAEMAAPATLAPSFESAPAIDDGLVACPICLIRMKENQVDRHLDKSCAGSPEAAEQQQQRRPGNSSGPSFSSHGFQTIPKSGPPQNFKRLPMLSYSMTKEPQLRKKLAELGISTAGSKQMMERRHKEWMTIWNANCDSLHPRSKRELLQELDLWERTMGMRAPTSSKHFGAQIKDKDFDHAAWSSKHETSFKDLVASARRNRAQAEQKVKEANAVPGPANPEPSETAPPVPMSMEVDATPVNLEVQVSGTPEPIFAPLPTTFDPQALPVEPLQKIDVVDLTNPLEDSLAS